MSDPRNPKAPTTLQYAQQVVGRIGNMVTGKPVPQAETQAPVQVASVDPVGRSSDVGSVPAAPIPVPEVAAADVSQPGWHSMPEAELQKLAVNPEQDPWIAFQRSLQGPVEAADMNYGPQAAPAFAMPQVERPDFMAALAGLTGRRRVNFQPMKARV